MDRVMQEHAETVARVLGPDRMFADVAEDWMRHGEAKRGLKRTTLRGYRQILDAYLLPAFGELPAADITTEMIEGWHSGFRRSRTAERVLVVMGTILGYAHRRGWVPDNAAQYVERHPVRYSGDYDFYSREEVEALVRAAASEQDAAIYATAAMTGLRRGELLALRWRDVDFAGQAIRVRGNYSFGEVVTPKSGKVRVVPMVPEVAAGLRASASASASPATTTRVLQRGRRPSRRLGAASPLPAGRPARRAPAAALSLPAPPLRLDRGQPRLACAGAGVDGPLAHPDHGALSTPPLPSNRCRVAGGGVCEPVARFGSD